MKSTRYQDWQGTDWLRLILPASAWAVLFGFFAVAGALSKDTPTQVADAASSMSSMAEACLQFSQDFNVSGAPSIDVPDAALAAHEVLDPVGAGHSAPL